MDFELQLEARPGELKVLHNEAGSSATRLNALEYDPNPRTLINVRIETVQYGSYDGSPAALIVLKFIVRFRPGSRRIKNFHVEIKFSNQTETAGSPSPAVLKLKPEDMRGRIFTEERSNTFTGGMEVPLGPPGAPTLSVSDEVARKINREYELRLMGWRKSSPTAIDDVLVWDCAEAKKAARGTVPNFSGACIVKYTADQPFIATFSVDAERGVFDFDSHVFEYLNVFAKREVDDPVIFTPGNHVGIRYPNLTDFKDLDLDSLIQLQSSQNLPATHS